MSYQHPDMYHDPAARSPGSQRHQQPLHRQHSRQFDAYGPMPVNLYEDQMARYDTSRLERLNPSIQNNSSYAYDLSGSQTWNPNGFANAQSLGGIRSASASLKPSARGRTALPTVRILSHLVFCFVVLFFFSLSLLPFVLSPPPFFFFFLLASDGPFPNRKSEIFIHSIHFDFDDYSPFYTQLQGLFG